MKKKILFVLPHMLGRGVEKSLINLLKYIPRNQYEITVMMIEKYGEFLKLLPNDVNVIEAPLPEKLKKEINQDIGSLAKVKNDIKKGRIITAVGRVYRKLVRGDVLGGYTVDFNCLEEVKEEYDIAVCYHIHCFYLIRYVAVKIKAKHKLAWVHNDFIDVGFDVRKYKKEFSYYEKIICVSRQVANEFIIRLPIYKDRVEVFYNIIPQKEIRESANDYMPVEFLQADKIFRILSVGSLEKQKGFDVALDVCERLVAEGYQVLWCVLGTGSEWKCLYDKVVSLNLLDNFKLCGLKENPYPYYKHCDLYVQPSRYEGYGIALAEARVLNCPIVSTDFSGAREQLVNGYNGEIVPFDKDKLYVAIKDLIEDKNKREQYKSNLLAEYFEETYADQVSILLNEFRR